MDANNISNAYNNSNQLRIDLKSLLPIKQQIENLEKLAIALEVYEFLRDHPEIKQWAVIFIKDYYNDEGLSDGVYVKATTDNSKIASPCLNYEDLPDRKETTIERQLNNILSKHVHFYDYKYTSHKNNETGLNQFILEFTGEQFFTQWKHANLEKNLLPVTKTTMAMKL